tara:strand:+ start:1193 stop:1552 length:360 start_codon:yes stop_codon:yes gene_type:complete
VIHGRGRLTNTLIVAFILERRLQPAFDGRYVKSFDSARKATDCDIARARRECAPKPAVQVRANVRYRVEVRRFVQFASSNHGLYATLHLPGRLPVWSKEILENTPSKLQSLPVHVDESR